MSNGNVKAECENECVCEGEYIRDELMRLLNENQYSNAYNNIHHQIATASNVFDYILLTNCGKAFFNKYADEKFFDVVEKKLDELANHHLVKRLRDKRFEQYKAYYLVNIFPIRDRKGI